MGGLTYDINALKKTITTISVLISLDTLALFCIKVDSSDFTTSVILF